MSNQTAVIANAEAPGVQLPGEDNDWFLVELVRLANSGLPLAITLVVGGTVISGTTISGKVFFEKFAEMLRDLGSKDADASFWNTLADDYEELKKPYVRPDGAADWSPPPASFIHLGDARIFIPGQPPMPANGLIWRGRLSQVSGFSLGRFQSKTK